MLHAQALRRGLIPLALDVRSLYLSHMATLSSRGHLLGTRPIEAEGPGASRPGRAFEPVVEAALKASDLVGSDVVVRRSLPRRLKGLRAASAIHARALGQSRRRSAASLACSDGIVVGDGAVAATSRVPGRFGTAAYALVGVIAVLLPGLLNSFLSNAAVSPAVRVAGVAVPMIIALVVGVECVRKVMLGLRWRRLERPGIELANVASWPGGKGAAGRLVDEVVQTAAGGWADFVVRVDRDNAAAVGLYRSRGFCRVDESSTGSLVAMRRRSQTAEPSSVNGRAVPAFIVCMVVATTFVLARLAANGIELAAIAGIGVDLVEQWRSLFREVTELVVRVVAFDGGVYLVER